MELSRWRGRLCAATLLGAAGLLAACGGGGSGDSQTSGPASPPASSPPPSSPPPSNPGPASGLSARPSNTTCIAGDKPAGSANITLVQVFTGAGFASPVRMLQAPGDSTRWFVVEQGGIVRSVDIASGNTAVVLDISARVDTTEFEGGLLGMAFHPDFQTNGFVYLSYTAAGSGGGVALVSRVSRFTSPDAGSSIDPASETILLSVDQPFGNHNGGHIDFGPDGFLYIGLGDGGSAGDPLGHAQNTATLLGALLRIDVNVSAQELASGTTYKIPPGNPFAASSNCAAGNCPEIYAWGLRNPWRWSFDPANGKLWLADVGQDAWEEVDQIINGGNYGWNIREGAHCFNAGSCAATGLIDPLAEYDHSQGCSVTGGYVYRGSAIPALQGIYLYGDFCSGRIWGLDDAPSPATTQVLIDNSGLTISSFAQAPDGEVYVLDHGGGGIYRVDPQPGSGGTVPSRLSASGCVSASDPRQPAAGMIPYDINAPFWSDSAVKERYLAIPDNAFVSINQNDDWDFPIGSVLMKHFRLAGKLIETRLFMRHSDGSWAGYSYEWDASETDATLLSAGKTKLINGQQWVYPSGAQCLICHTAAAGRVLGPETAQMNRDFTYPSTGITANQLDTFSAINLFNAGLSAPTAGLPRLLDPFGASSDVHGKARAYLYTNCAPCHRAGGTAPVAIDLDYRTAHANMNICNAAPQAGDLGIAGALVVAPGDHARSLLWVRMQRRDAPAMPPLGSTLVDTAGAALLQAWIDGMGVNCL